MIHRLPKAVTVLPRIAFAVGNSTPFNRLAKNHIPIALLHSTPNYGKELAHTTRTRLHDHTHLRSLSSTPTKSARRRFPRSKRQYLELPDKPIKGLSQRRDDYFPASFARDPKPLSTETERDLDNQKRRPKKPREVSLVASFIRHFLKTRYNLEIPLNDQFHLVVMLKQRLHVLFPAGDWDTAMVKALIELKLIEMRRPRTRRKFLELPNKPIEGLSQRRDDYFPASFARDPKPLSTETERELDNQNGRPKKPREVSLVASFIRHFLKTRYNLEIPLNDQLHLVEMLMKRLHVLFPAGDWEISMVKSLIELDTIKLRSGFQRKLQKKRTREPYYRSSGCAPTQLDIMSCTGNVPVVFLGKPIEGLSQRRDDYYPIGLARDPKLRVDDDRKRRLSKTPEEILVADCIRRFLKSQLYNANLRLYDQYYVVEILRQKLQVVFPAGDWNLSIVNALLIEKKKQLKGVQERKIQSFPGSGSIIREVPVPASDISVALSDKPIKGLSKRRDDYYPADLALDRKSQRKLKKPRERALVASYIRCFLQSEGYDFNMTPSQKLCVVENLKKKLQAVFPAGDWKTSPVKQLIRRKLEPPKFR